MPDLLFDKLIYVDRLTRAGFSDEQARAHADAMDEALRESVVTKPYLHTELLALKLDLTLRMGAIGVAIVVMLASIKFFV